jgi:hypothetical protein
MLCVICVVIVMVVGANIGTHNKDNVRLWANLYLGGPTKSITPQIFETHPTLGQHQNHIKKAFHSKLFIKRLPKSRRIQNYN